MTNRIELIRKIKLEMSDVKSKVKKEGFPIPSPSGDESENDFIGRCNSVLYDEFPDDAQRNAVCYKAWDDK